MRSQGWIIRRLIGLYPARWRTEYGQELESLLVQRGLTFAAALDVAWGALVQRVRYARPWRICAWFLLICRTAALVWNSAAPFSSEGYAWFTNGVTLILFGTAFWTTFQRDVPTYTAVEGAAGAALLSMLPDFVLCLLWASEFITPVILPGGAAGPHGGGLALLHVRSSGPVDLHPGEVFFMEAVMACLGGAVIGLLGGAAGARLSARLRWR